MLIDAVATVLALCMIAVIRTLDIADRIRRKLP